jgi:hypothetical protein
MAFVSLIFRWQLIRFSRECQEFLRLAESLLASQVSYEETICQCVDFLNRHNRCLSIGNDPQKKGESLNQTDR